MKKLLALVAVIFLTAANAFAVCDEVYDSCEQGVTDNEIACVQDTLNYCNSAYPNCPGAPENNQCPQSQTCKRDGLFACRQTRYSELSNCVSLFNYCVWLFGENG